MRNGEKQEHQFYCEHGLLYGLIAINYNQSKYTIRSAVMCFILQPPCIARNNGQREILHHKKKNSL